MALKDFERDYPVVRNFKFEKAKLEAFRSGNHVWLTPTALFEPVGAPHIKEPGFFLGGIVSGRGAIIEHGEESSAVANAEVYITLPGTLGRLAAQLARKAELPHVPITVELTSEPQSISM